MYEQLVKSKQILATRKQKRNLHYNSVVPSTLDNHTPKNVKSTAFPLTLEIKNINKRSEVKLADALIRQSSKGSFFKRIQVNFYFIGNHQEVDLNFSEGGVLKIGELYYPQTSYCW